MTKIVNYTPEVTAEVLAAFADGMAVEAIALKVGKSMRSVIAKLSREGVYTAKAKAKAADKAETKAEMLAKVEVALGVKAGTFASFEKATKGAIEALVAATANEFEGFSELR